MGKSLRKVQKLKRKPKLTEGDEKVVQSLFESFTPQKKKYGQRSKAYENIN